MALDKSIGFAEVTLTTAADSNWVQDNTIVLMDNSSGVVPKNVKTLFLNGSFIAATNDKKWAVLLVVTAKDSTVPTFTGTDANFNTQLEKYKDLIWATEFKYCKQADFEGAASCSIEPSTGRTLEPGQKLVAVVMCSCADTGAAAANSLYCLMDWNIWYTYG